jgi:hypothetical protein
MTDCAAPTSLDQRLQVLECLLRRSLHPAIDLRQTWGAHPDRVTAATYFILDLVSETTQASSSPQAPQGQPTQPALSSADLDFSRLAGVDPFVQHTLGRLLLQLSHHTEQRQEVYHGQVRGRILWNATYKARYSEEYNPATYVCAQVQHRFDTPENQLLKYLLEHIEDCLKAVPAEIRCGVCYLPEGEARLLQDTTQRLETLETAINRLKRSVRLREVTTPETISERHLLRAATARTEEYGAAAGLYGRYQRMVLQPSWEWLAEAARRVLPLPDRLTPASQRWVYLAADLMRFSA